MSLVELVDNTLTDKNTAHSYMELYESLFQSKKESAQNILEIGIGDFQEKNGGSLKLWYNYFTNATIHGIDILSSDRIIDELKNNDRVVLYTESDGYDETFFNATFLEKNIKFDVLLDDGPHTYESMVQFIKLYSQVMTDDGILIIEDVQDWEWIDYLYNIVPEELKPYV
jgi:spermidine synthase